MQTLSFNRIIMHTIGSFRQDIVGDQDPTRAALPLRKFVDIAGKLVGFSRRHMEAIEDILRRKSCVSESFSSDLQALISTSFVGSIVPIVLFSLHVVLRDLQGIDPGVAMETNQIFTEACQAFQLAYSSFLASTTSGNVSRSTSYNLSRENSLIGINLASKI